MARLGLGTAVARSPRLLEHRPRRTSWAPTESVDALRARAHEVLDFAYEAGIRDFDTARSYGRGEEFLGEWLRSRNPVGVTRLLQVGLRLHGRLGDRGRPARGQAPRRRDVPAPARGDALEPRRLARPLPDPLGHARQRRAEERRRADRDGRGGRAAGRVRVRHEPGRDDRPRGVAGDLHRRAGDVEPARARGRATRWRGAG